MYFDAESVEPRIEALLNIEAEIMLGLAIRPALH
jgi:hypothetical protein